MNNTETHSLIVDNEPKDPMANLLLINTNLYLILLSYISLNVNWWSISCKIARNTLNKSILSKLIGDNKLLEIVSSPINQIIETENKLKAVLSKIKIGLDTTNRFYKNISNRLFFNQTNIAQTASVDDLIDIYKNTTDTLRSLERSTTKNRV